MIRPLDMQVNLNAVPEYARQVTAAQSGVVDREIRENKKIRQENLDRTESVPEISSDAEATFPRVEPEELQQHPLRAGSALRQAEELKGKGELESPSLSPVQAVRGKGKRGSEKGMRGGSVDLFA